MKYLNEIRRNFSLEVSQFVGRNISLEVLNQMRCISLEVSQ